MEPVAIVLTTVGWLINALLGKAITVLLEEWAERVGLDKEFATLKQELVKIKATLETAGHSETTNSALLEMLKDLQQLAYQADDLLDELDYYRIKDDVVFNGGISSIQVTESASSSSTPSSSFKSAGRVLLSAFRQASCSTVQDDIMQLPSSIPSKSRISRRMKDLVQELRKFGKDVRELQLEAGVSAIHVATVDNRATLTNPRETTSHMTERVYGRDQERDHLIELLVGDEASNQALSFIAIIGQGGIGKTTLAELVYNDQRVKNHFGLQMWVTVSDKFDVKRLTHEILEGANSGSNQDFKNLNNLQCALKKNLESRRYLLVLDDMWEDDNRSHWELLMAPLRDSPINGNVVLITTRKPGVVKLDRTIISYNLYGLEKNEFWSLFKACSFGNDMHEGRRNLEIIGVQIVEKLKGNPLAARTVGPLLNNNLDEEHWRQVLESKEWNYQNDENYIMPALELSYKHLLPQLKRCFSYCATFPKDYRFEQIELVRLWIAQNFIHSNVEGKRMEDIAEKYLEDLINNGFFQKLEKNLTGSVYNYYVIHDLLHDLAQKVSMGECLSVDGHTDSIAIKPTVRHLSITRNSEKELIDLQKNLNPTKLSTIYFLGRSLFRDDMDSETLESFQTRFKDATGLRVLILKNVPNPQPLLRSVVNYTHLRYLKLNFRYSCDTLPEEICQLYHLQVLDVKEWSELVNLPYKFNNLVNLRHFIGPYRMPRMLAWGPREPQSLHSLIPGVGKLSHLQELDEFVVGNKREFEVAQLKGLKELRGVPRIHDLQNVKSMEEAECAGLSEKKFLNELHLSWRRRRRNFLFENMFSNSITNVVHDADANVIEGLRPHSNLKVLTINTYGGATSPAWLANNILFNLVEVNLTHCCALEILPPLGQLSFLKRLCLYLMNAVKEIGPHLYGDNNYNCVAFQCLEVLKIGDMPSLKEWVWSDQCQCFPALKELEISNCPELLVTNSSLNGNEINERFPCLHKFHVQSDAPLQPMLQMHPIPCSESISDMHIKNVGQFEEIKLHKLELTIHNPLTPIAWNYISFINLRSIISLEISSKGCLIDITWETLCLLTCLQKLSIKDSPSLFSFMSEGIKKKKPFQLVSLRELSLHLCGTTGKDLSLLMYCTPMLSSLIVHQCHLINRIEVDTSTHEPDLQTYVLNFGEDEGLLRIPSSLVYLQNLSIEKCPDLEFVSNSGFSPLISLLSITIRGCSRLLSSMIYKQSIRAGYLLRPRPREVSINNAPEGTSQLLSSLYSLLFNNSEIITGGYHIPPGLQELDNLPEGTSQLLFGLYSLYINTLEIIRGGYPLPPRFQEISINDVPESISQLLFGLQYSPNSVEIISGGYLLPPGLRELSIDNAPEGTSQLLAGLYSLKSLEIIDSPELVSLDLSFCLLLNKLKFNHCQGLALLKGLENLVLLRELEVHHCPSFADAWIKGSNEEVTIPLQQLVTDNAAILAMPICKQLTSLYDLSFRNLNIANLTEEQEEALLLLTSLKFLSFISSPNLCHLPATLHLHPSIEMLNIWFCPNIKPFPERSLPKKLTELTVLSCNPEVERLSMEYRKHLDMRRRQ